MAKGLRDIVKRKTANIKAQIRTNIFNCLGSYNMTMMLDISFLDRTVSSITTLFIFISDTHQDLKDDKTNLKGYSDQLTLSNIELETI